MTMSKLNILAVYPHPADSATEASGTLALHAERGDIVTSVIATYGERHHMQWLYDEEQKPESERDPAIINMTLQEYRAFKKREAERIADILGVSELIFLGWTDQEVDFNWERVAEIRDLIMRVRPDIVITHLPVQQSGGQDDHPTVGRIVMNAIWSAANRVRQFDGVEPYRGVKQVFFSVAGGEEANSRNLLAGGIVCDVMRLDRVFQPANAVNRNLREGRLSTSGFCYSTCQKKKRVIQIRGALKIKAVMCHPIGIDLTVFQDLTTREGW